MGYVPYFASELEFYLYKDSYSEAHGKDYRDLTPTIPYILDYHILATTMDEAYLRPIRRGMHGAGIPVEFSKGEAWYGQHEVNTSPTRSPRRTGTRSTRTASRRSRSSTGSRRPSWPSPREGHRELVPHPLEPGARRPERLRGRR